MQRCKTGRACTRRNMYFSNNLFLKFYFNLTPLNLLVGQFKAANTSNKTKFLETIFKRASKCGRIIVSGGWQIKYSVKPKPKTTHLPTTTIIFTFYNLKLPLSYDHLSTTARNLGPQGNWRSLITGLTVCETQKNSIKFKAFYKNYSFFRFCFDLETVKITEKHALPTQYF